MNIIEKRRVEEVGWEEGRARAGGVAGGQVAAFIYLSDQSVCWFSDDSDRSR